MGGPSATGGLLLPAALTAATIALWATGRLPEYLVALLFFGLGTWLAWAHLSRDMAGRQLAASVVDEGATRGAIRSQRETNEALERELERVRRAAAAPNVRVLDRALDRRDLWALVLAADCFLSTHRSEGFGFGIAEAMRAGRPVVATGWSGNVDFMVGEGAVALPYDLVPARDPQRTYALPGAVWAEPRVPDAAAALSMLADDPARRGAMGRAAGEAAEALSPASVSARALPGGGYGSQSRPVVVCAKSTSRICTSPRFRRRLLRSAAGPTSRSSLRVRRSPPRAAATATVASGVIARWPPTKPIRKEAIMLFVRSSSGTQIAPGPAGSRPSLTWTTPSRPRGPDGAGGAWARPPRAPRRRGRSLSGALIRGRPAGGAGRGARGVRRRA